MTQVGDEESTSASLKQPHDIEAKRAVPGVSSRMNVANIGGGVIQQKAEEVKQNLDPRLGYDLSQINTHYLHRRRLRKEKMVLRYGEFMYLTARDEQDNWQDSILAFARYSLMETVIIATNLSEQEKAFYVDAAALMPTFKRAYSNNTVVMVKNCLQDHSDPQYYFLREFLELREIRELAPYHSMLISLQIIDDDQYIFKKCLTTSIERLKRNLVTGEKSIESEQISLLFMDCIENDPEDIERFANIIGSI